MARYIELDALLAEIERIDKSIGCDRFLSEYEKGCNQGKEEVCDTLRNFLDTLEVKEVQEKPVSEDLEEAAVEAFKQIVDTDKNNFLEIFKAGAKWKDKQITKDAIDSKEVDFDAEWKKYFEYRGEVATVNVKHLAKHFFELGIQQSKNKQQL